MLSKETTELLEGFEKRMTSEKIAKKYNDNSDTHHIIEICDN